MLTEQLTVREASVVTHVPVSKVNAMIDDGNLPAGVVVRSRRRTTKKLRFLKPEACAMIKYNASTGVPSKTPEQKSVQISVFSGLCEA